MLIDSIFRFEFVLLNNFSKMSQVCFICSKPLAESEIVFVERGIKTLIDSSIERNDGYVEYLKDKQSVTIHVECRKMYTRKSSIAAAKRQREMEASTSSSSPPRTRARSGEPIFCFKKFCLFCGDEANEETEKKKAQNIRRTIYRVTTLSFKDNILKVAHNRSDDVAKAVIARIQYEYDLVAAEAKYHNNIFIIIF